LTLASRVTPVDHCLGREDAPVTLVQYGDYECSFCAAAQPILRDVRRRLGDALRFVFRHFPLPQVHPHAVHAAESAEAAADQDAFWLMHDTLYRNQRSLRDADLLSYAAELGLDTRRVAKDLVHASKEQRVHRDVSSGIRSGVRSTPAFFINTVRHDGPWDTGSLLIALERAAHITTRGK
jgi:protein-disulfide isomerase